MGRPSNRIAPFSFVYRIPIINIMISSRLIGFGLFTAIILSSLQVTAWSAVAQCLAVFIIAAIVMFALYPAVSSRNSAAQMHLPVIGVAAVGLVLYWFCGIGWSAVPHYAMEAFDLYAVLPFLVIAGCFGGSRLSADLRWLADAVAVYAVLLAICGAYQAAIGAGYFYGAAHYPFINPNTYAVLVGVGAVLCLINMAQAMVFSRKILYAAGCVICVGGIVVADSMGALLAFLSAAAMIAATSVVKNRWWRQAGIATGVVLLLLIVVLALNPFLFETAIDPLRASIVNRMEIWQGASAAIAEGRLWTGYGAGTFKAVYPPHRVVGDETIGLHAHNDTLHLLLEFGIIGLCLYGAMAFGIISVVMRSPLWRSYLPVVVFVLICSQFTLTVQHTPVLIFIGAVFMAAIADYPSDRRLYGWGRVFAQAMFVAVLALLLLSVQKTLIHYMERQVEAALYAGDSRSMLSGIDRIDVISLYSSPTVPTIKASFLLGLYSTAPKDERDIYAREIGGYLDDASRRHPYNPVVQYYRGELAYLQGRQTDAVEFYRQSLVLDRTYRPAQKRLTALSQ